MISSRKILQYCLISFVLIIYIIIIRTSIIKYKKYKNNFYNLKQFDNSNKKIINFKISNNENDTDQIKLCNTNSECNISIQEICITVDKLTNVYVYDRIHPIQINNANFNGICGKLSNDKKTLTCSPEKGGRFHLYKDKNLKSTYSWFCKCLHPWIFDKPYELDVFSDCSYYKGCTNREYTINDKQLNDPTEIYNSISCKCLNHEYQIKTQGVYQCRSGNYFQITDNVVEDKYNLSINEIDKSWIQANFGTVENFKRLRPHGIPNPCLYDAMTNKKIDDLEDKIGIDNTNGIYFCFSKSPQYVTIQFTSDYLANNDGKYPNGIVKIGSIIPDTIMVEDSTYDSINSILYPPLCGWKMKLDFIEKELLSLLKFNLVTHSKYPFEHEKKIKCLIFYNAPNAIMELPLYVLLTNPLYLHYHNISIHEWNYKYYKYRTIGIGNNTLLRISSLLGTKYKDNKKFQVLYGTYTRPNLLQNYQVTHFTSKFDHIPEVSLNKSSRYTTTELYYRQFKELKKYNLFNTFLFMLSDKKSILYNPFHDMYTGVYEIHLRNQVMYPFYIGNNNLRKIFKTHVLNIVLPANGIEHPNFDDDKKSFDIIWFETLISSIVKPNTISLKKFNGNISDDVNDCEDLETVSEKSLLRYFSHGDTSTCEKYTNEISIAVIEY